jgi:hypothetical protein
MTIGFCYLCGKKGHHTLMTPNGSVCSKHANVSPAAAQSAAPSLPEAEGQTWPQAELENGMRPLGLRGRISELAERVA